MADSKFGFTVEFKEAHEWSPETGWKVYLPHQCDQWRIDTWSAYNDPSTQEQALEALDQFIVEAMAARDALARGEQHGEAS